MKRRLGLLVPREGPIPKPFYSSDVYDSEVGPTRDVVWTRPPSSAGFKRLSRIEPFPICVLLRQAHAVLRSSSLHTALWRERIREVAA